MSTRDKEIVTLAAAGTAVGIVGPVALLVAGVVDYWIAIGLLVGIPVAAWLALQIVKGSAGAPERPTR